MTKMVDRCQHPVMAAGRKGELLQAIDSLCSSAGAAGEAGLHAAWRGAFHGPDVAHVKARMAELVRGRTGGAVAGVNRPARGEWGEIDMP